MKPILAFSVLLASLLPCVALATPPEAAPVAALDAALLTTMQAGSAGQSFTARDAALAPVIRQSFNLPVVTQNSVGFLWSTLPAAQQQTLVGLMGSFTTASYVAEFSSFHGEKFTLLPAEKTLGDEKIIETRLDPSSGSPTELDYVVADGPHGWQITDVLLDGTISQVAVHASDFSSLVNQGDASPLIKALRAKIASLSSGTHD